VIFGVAVVFPVVITFGVAGVLAGRRAGVFPVVITFGVDSPGVAPGKANSYRRSAPVNNVPARC